MNCMWYMTGYSKLEDEVPQISINQISKRAGHQSALAPSVELVIKFTRRVHGIIYSASPQKLESYLVTDDIE